MGNEVIDLCGTKSVTGITDALSRFWESRKQLRNAIKSTYMNHVP